MQPPADGHHPPEGISGSELRRDVSVWGSYMWGYAAVGADIYTALGIITLAALGLAPLAFLAAGIVFALVGILVLIWLNVRGIKVSTNFNEIIGTIAIVAQTIIVLAGFVLVWKPELVAHEFLFDRPSLSQFAFGSSLAIIAFVGLETISQVAQETRRPATIIPRTSIGLVISVLLFAMAFSVLAIGLLKPTDFIGHEGDPVALIAAQIPVIGAVAAPMTALIGFLIVFISANSGVVSASRLSYSMAQFDLLPTWFSKVSRRFATPARAVIAFGMVALLQTIFAFFTPGPPGKSAAIDVLAELYAFGATTGYLLVFISLFVLRFRDPYTPRPYKMPINIRVNYKGRYVWFPVLGVLGFLGVLFFLIMVLLTHQYARIVGPLWVLAAVALFAWYRRKRGLPILKTMSRDWESATKRVLLEAEEFKSLEEYEAALGERHPGPPQ